MTEQDLIELGFEKIIGEPEWLQIKWHYYTLYLTDELCLISNDSDNAKDGTWYVELFDYDNIKIHSKEDVKTFIEIIKRNIL